MPGTSLLKAGKLVEGQCEHYRISLFSALPLPCPAPKGESYTPTPPNPTKSRNSRHHIRIKLKFKTFCGNFRGVAYGLSHARDAWSTHPGLTGPQEIPDRWADHNPACWPLWSDVIGGLFPGWGMGTQRSREYQRLANSPLESETH